MSWQELPILLCSSQDMNEDSVLMLSCCRGGIMDVAYTIFLACHQICYVLGPRQGLTTADMQICFGIFLYNKEMHGVDPVVECYKIKHATDQRFSCYDREEESINLINYNNLISYE